MTKLKTILLFGYNLLLFAIHLIAFIKVVIVYAYEPDGSFNDVSFYPFLGTWLQLVDVFNGAFGITRTNPMTACVQVFGRLIVLYMIAYTPYLWTADSSFLLLFVYMLVEIIRYPYYMLKVVNVEYEFVTWLRYNAFLLLYPIGFSIEGISLYNALDYLYSIEDFVLDGNTLSIPYDINLIMILAPIISLALPFAAVKLFSHMLIQRENLAREKKNA